MMRFHIFDTLRFDNGSGYLAPNSCRLFVPALAAVGRAYGGGRFDERDTTALFQSGGIEIVPKTNILTAFNAIVSTKLPVLREGIILKFVCGETYHVRALFLPQDGIVLPFTFRNVPTDNAGDYDPHAGDDNPEGVPVPGRQSFRADVTLTEAARAVVNDPDISAVRVHLEGEFRP